MLLTGLHAVADIFCQSCKTPLGWKYVSWGMNRFTGKPVKVIERVGVVGDGGWVSKVGHRRDGTLIALVGSTLRD